MRKYQAAISCMLIAGMTLAACGSPSPPQPADEFDRRSLQEQGSPTPYTPLPGEIALPTLTPTSQQPISEPTEPEAAVEDCTLDSKFEADLTIPDGTLIKPGDSFTKTWRIRNNGTCTWTSEFTWEQVNAENNRLFALEQVTPLPTDVPPGETLDISILLVMHEEAPLGSKQVARFQLRSPSGEFFGARPYTAVFAVDGRGRCPVGTDDLLTYIHLTDRYCFLYPSTHNTNIGQDGTLYVSLPAPQGSTEELTPTVSISNRGSTGGLALRAWADQQIEAAQDPGNPASISQIFLGNLAVLATEDLPGMASALNVYVVRDGIGFVFVVTPLDGSYGPDTLDLWDTIRDLFVFYNP